MPRNNGIRRAQRAAPSPSHHDMTSDQKETEAEATAFIVCQHFGIETNAPNYLAHWSSPEQIKASAHRILIRAEQIINACEQ